MGRPQARVAALRCRTGFVDSPGGRGARAAAAGVRLRRLPAGQREIIEHVVGGGDALVLMPTGGGKSLCYQIPALARPGVGVVISPLIALMQDQVDALRALGVRAGFLNSTQDPGERRMVEAEFRAGELDLLYLAPEALRSPSTVALLDQGKIALFAIDEAHCVCPVGARLPARLPGAVDAARALARGAADRADRHGDHRRRTRRSRPGSTSATRCTSSRASTGPTSNTGSWPRTSRAGSCSTCCAGSTPATPASSTACPGHRPRRQRSSCPATGSRRCRTTPGWTRRPGRRTRPGSCARTAWSSSRRSRSGWGSTSRTYASSPISTCRSRWRATTRRPAGPGGTGCRRRPGWRTGCRTWCSSGG